jgi:outer membrane protein assembly factor BamA
MVKSLLSIIIFVFALRAFPGEKTDSVITSSDYSVKIDSIIINGNIITDEFIILRELTFHKGDMLTHSVAAYNRDRVYSLNIFNKVTIKPVISEGKTFAVIDVEEAWYIWPIPFAELKDRDWKKISYGLDLSVKNFRGMNETIRTRFAFGYDPMVSVSYTRPAIFYGSNSFLTVAVSYADVQNLSVLSHEQYGSIFDQKQVNAQVILGERFSLFHNVSITGGFNYIETPVYVPRTNINVSNGRIDRMFYIGAGYVYDTRDLAQFPKNGILGTANVMTKGLGMEDISYQVYTFDFRDYQRLFDDFHSKWRVASRITTGTVPSYDISFLGYGERIRGNSQVVLEGNNYYVTNLEFFHPVIKDMDLDFSFVPIVPKQLLSYRVALYAEIFGDAGTVTQRGENIRINNFESGYGFGFTLLILPYNIFRVELAFNDYFKSELLVDLGISF